MTPKKKLCLSATHLHFISHAPGVSYHLPRHAKLPSPLCCQRPHAACCAGRSAPAPNGMVARAGPQLGPESTCALASRPRASMLASALTGNSATAGALLAVGPVPTGAAACGAWSGAGAPDAPLRPGPVCVFLKPSLGPPAVPVAGPPLSVATCGLGERAGPCARSPSAPAGPTSAGAAAGSPLPRGSPASPCALAALACARSGSAGAEVALGSVAAASGCASQLGRSATLVKWGIRSPRRAAGVPGLPLRAGPAAPSLADGDAPPAPADASASTAATAAAAADAKVSRCARSAGCSGRPAMSRSSAAALSSAAWRGAARVGLGSGLSNVLHRCAQGAQGAARGWPNSTSLCTARCADRRDRAARDLRATRCPPCAQGRLEPAAAVESGSGEDRHVEMRAWMSDCRDSEGRSARSAVRRLHARRASSAHGSSDAAAQPSPCSMLDCFTARTI